MKKVVAIALALLMLTSNLGLAVCTHYCGGMAVKSKIMLGHNQLDCGMGDMTEDDEFESDAKAHFTKTPCCENQYLHYEIEDEFQISLLQFGISPEFPPIFVHEFLKSSIPTEIDASRYADYSPPLTEQDIHVLYQVFII